MRSAGRASLVAWTAAGAFAIAGVHGTASGGEPRGASFPALSANGLLSEYLESETGVPGVTNAIRPVRVRGYPGPARACVAPGRECRDVLAPQLVAIGSYLDTTKGAVSLETRRANGTAARMTVYGGVLQLLQAKARNAILVARLAGGSFAAACAPPRARTLRATLRAAAPLSRSRRRVRKLWGDGEGRFRSKGRHGAATVRGTRFLVTDRCDGTLVRVVRGQVAVRGRHRGRSVRVRAPSSRLLKAPQR